MLCESCQKFPAVVHLTIQESFVDENGVRDTSREASIEKHHFCADCADEYYRANGMNCSRDLIQLSDRYRSKLYDVLAVEHPEVFSAPDDKLREAAEVMADFLRKKLKSDGIEVNDDAFDMLCNGFIGSAELYERKAVFRQQSDQP